MTVDQLPARIREFANYLDGLVARLDQGGGWCAVFWQRDPEGMQACLQGYEVPPWDVVEALLQDLAVSYGPDAAAHEADRAHALHAAALIAYDTRPGGRDVLGDRLDVMLREQRYAAERQAELGRLLASATTQDAADAIRLDLAWAHDDHERATARCAELRARMFELDRRQAGAQVIRRDHQGNVFQTDDVFSEDSGSRSPAAPRSGMPRRRDTAPDTADWRLGQRAAAETATWHEAPDPEPQGTHDPRYDRPGRDAAAESRPGATRPSNATRGGYGGPRATRPAYDTPGGYDTSRARTGPAYDTPADYDSLDAPTPDLDTQPPATPEPPAVDTVPAPAPTAKQRKRRRGSARFAGMVDDESAAVPAPMAAVPDIPVPAPTTARTRGGARFAGAVATAEPAEPQTDPLDAEARRATAEAVASLVRLRREGRSGEAHAVLVEAAYWPAARFPLLAAELQRAGLGADWQTLLWEAGSLPADRLVAAADALVAAGRAGDGEQILRQGVARPPGEIGEAVLGLVEDGRRREARALLDTYVNVRTPEEAAHSVEADPQRLVPLLLEAARGVSGDRHRDLVHALRVAGFSA